MEVYRLMIKEHCDTKMKYLCITKREDYINYKGSGTYWNAHLKKYGDNITTHLLFSSENYSEFLEKCYYYSDFLDVVNSKEFANLVPEYGYSNLERVGKTNFELWWDYLSEEAKLEHRVKLSNSRKEWWKNLSKEEQERYTKIYIKNFTDYWDSITDEAREEIYLRRGYSIRDAFKNMPLEKREAINQKISEASSKWWEKFDLDTRREMTERMRAFSLLFFEDKESERFKEFCKKTSEIVKNRYANMTEEEYANHCKKMSQARLNLSEEKKLARKEKIIANYLTDRYDEIWKKMSEARKGLDNPAAKKIVWYGETYTKMEFEKKFGKYDSIENKEIFKKNNLECFILFNEEKKEYEQLICPICGKSSNIKNKPSSFKRWHFENCKGNK